RVIEAEAAQRPGREVVEHDVRFRDEALEHGFSFRLREIQRQVLLVAVEGVEGRPRAGGAARGVAGHRVLDLDDVRAEIAEHQPAARSGDDMGQLEDADALEREFLRSRSVRRHHASLPTRDRGLGTGDSGLRARIWSLNIGDWCLRLGFDACTFGAWGLMLVICSASRLLSFYDALLF